MTFKQARATLLVYLASTGYKVKADLKVPQAIHPNGHVLRFHAQAVYLDAHSLNVDIRVMSTADFREAIEFRMNQLDSNHEQD